MKKSLFCLFVFVFGLGQRTNDQDGDIPRQFGLLMGWRVEENIKG